MRSAAAWRAHYPRDMAPFSAIAEPSAAAYADLAAGLPAGHRGAAVPAADRAAAGWLGGDQPLLACCRWWRRGTPERGGDLPVIALSQADAPAMLDLVAATEPGPFGPRTPLLGRYLGIRHGDRLVAMAGERLRVPGHVELSAICVHPEARGKGYGAALTQSLMRQAFAERRGAVPACPAGQQGCRDLVPAPGLRDAPRVGGAVAPPEVDDSSRRLARRLGGLCRRHVRLGRRLLWTGRLLGGVASRPRLADRHDLARDHRAFPGERGPHHRLARRLSPFRRRFASPLRGAVCAAAGAVAWTSAQQIWQLVPALLLSGAGWSAMSGAALNAIVAPWFERDRPKAISMAFNGASIGGLLFTPLWTALIAHAGLVAAGAGGRPRHGRRRSARWPGASCDARRPARAVEGRAAAAASRAARPAGAS